MKRNIIKEFNSKRAKNKKHISAIKLEAIKKETDLVWTDNDVATQGVFPFSSRQLKIIDYILTEIKEQDITKEKNTLTIKISDLINFLHMNNSGSVYIDLDDDIKIIRDTSAWWRYDPRDPKKKTLFAFFETVDAVEGKKGTYTIGFNKHLLDKINQKEPKKIYHEDGTPEKIGFNFYPLLNTKDLRSKYSIILYKICNVWKSAPRGYFERTLEDIKKDFLLVDHMDEKKKKRITYSYGYINRNCLQPAMKEINEKTDILISKIETYPNKRAVEKIIFFIKPKSEERQLALALKKEEERDDYFDTIEEKNHEISMDKAVAREEKRALARRKEILKKRYYKKLEEEAKQKKEQEAIAEREEINIIVEATTKYGLSIDEMRKMSIDEIIAWIENKKK